MKIRNKQNTTAEKLSIVKQLGYNSLVYESIYRTIISATAPPHMICGKTAGQLWDYVIPEIKINQFEDLYYEKY